MKSRDNTFSPIAHGGGGGLDGVADSAILELSEPVLGEGEGALLDFDLSECGLPGWLCVCFGLM